MNKNLKELFQETNNVVNAINAIEENFSTISDRIENAYRENETIYAFIQDGEIYYSNEEPADGIILGFIEEQSQEDWENDETNVQGFVAEMLDTKQQQLLVVFQQNMEGIKSRMKSNTYDRREMNNLFFYTVSKSDFEFNPDKVEEYQESFEISGVEYGVDVEYTHLDEEIKVEKINVY